MKQLITFSLLLSITMLNAQVISLTDFSKMEAQVSSGDYVKDMDNLLDPYVGDWMGEENGRKYLLRVAKGISFLEKETNTRIDALRMRYKVTNVATGNEVANILSLENDNYLVVYGFVLSETLDYYEMYYMGKEADCGEEGSIYLRINKNNDDEMYFLYIPTTEIWLVNACIDNKPTPLFPRSFLLKRKK